MAKQNNTISITSIINEKGDTLILKFRNTGIDLENKKHSQEVQDIAKTMQELFTLIASGHDIDSIDEMLNS